MALALAAAPLGVRDWRMLDAYPAQYVARRLAPSESIAVDGRLDDDAWTTTPWTEGMVDITRHTDEQRDAVPADLQARVKIRWDADYFLTTSTSAPSSARTMSTPSSHAPRVEGAVLVAPQLTAQAF